MKNFLLFFAISIIAGIAIGSSVLIWLKVSEVSAKLNKESSNQIGASAARKEVFQVENFMCARPDWCGVDFTRLAAHPEVLVGKRVFILGYLAVDHGVVSLFASKEAYMRMEEGRSLEIGGNRRVLSSLVRVYGNSYVRIEGTYEPPYAGRGRSARLGTLVPPIGAHKFNPRSFEQGVDDILVRVRYPDDSAAENKGNRGHGGN